MKIIVFGATGAMGKLIVSQALAKGHSVTAFVRKPEGLTPGSASSRNPGGPVRSRYTGGRCPRPPRGAVCARRAQPAKGGHTGQRHPCHARGDAPGRARYTAHRVLGASGGLNADHGKYQNALTNGGHLGGEKDAAQTPLHRPDRARASAGRERCRLHHCARPPAPGWTLHRHLPRPAGCASPRCVERLSRADVADFMLQQLTDPRFHRQGPYIGSGKV